MLVGDLLGWAVFFFFYFLSLSQYFSLNETFESGHKL